MVEVIGLCVSCGVSGELEAGLCADCWDGDVSSVVEERVRVGVYRQTEAGQAYVRRYNGSDPAKAARKKYARSEKGKLSQQRYYSSEKGQAALERARRKLELAKRFSELEALGLCGLCGGGGHKAEVHVVGEMNGSE